jgi:hypothetical protein
MSDNVEISPGEEAGFDGFMPVLHMYAKAGGPRRLSGLAELSYLGGRAGDAPCDWTRDIDGALSELPGGNGRRRADVLACLKDHFEHGWEAHHVDAANPPEMARNFASGIALGAVHRLRRASDEEVDLAIEQAARSVARQLPVGPAAAAGAAFTAFVGQGFPGSRDAASKAMIAAREGWRERGGYAADRRETAEAVLSLEFEDAGDAVAALAAAFVEQLCDTPAEAAELSVEAAECRGFVVEERHAEQAVAAASAAREACKKRRLEEDEPPTDYPSDGTPPKWWTDLSDDGIPARFELTSEPGLLGDLARWSVGYAFRPVPEFAALVALATLAPVFSRRFATPTGAGLNLYLIGLAETGGGKEAVIGAPQALLAAAKLEFLIGAGDFTSDSAIELALRARPNFIACIDEVSEFIGAAQHRNAAAHSRTLRKAMLELYSKARPDARWSGKQKVDADNADKGADPIYSPHLSLLGCSTITGFFEALTEANLTGGFVNRWIVVRGGKPDGFNADPARMTVPDSLSTALTAAYGDTVEGNLAGGNARDPFKKPNMSFVPWGDGGEEAWNSVLLSQCEAVDAGRSEVVGRAAENCLKVATIRALARDGIAAAVTDRDVLWAWEIVRASIETVEAGARENMAGSDFEMCVNTMQRYIVEAGPEGIAWSKLMEKRGLAKHKDEFLEAARKRLETRGVIYKPTIGVGPQGGRPGVRVIATQFTRE